MSDKTGGPAFPMAGVQSQQGEWQNPFQYGMSLRDFFAAATLTGLMASGAHPDGGYKAIAEWCFDQADSMLAEREKERK